jgi:hypothetical protein
MLVVPSVGRRWWAGRDRRAEELVDRVQVSNTTVRYRIFFGLITARGAFLPGVGRWTIGWTCEVFIGGGIE